jgi:hypothetical protein
LTVHELSHGGSQLKKGANGDELWRCEGRNETESCGASGATALGWWSMLTHSLASIHPQTKFDTAAEMTFFLQVYNLLNIYVVSK